MILYSAAQLSAILDHRRPCFWTICLSAACCPALHRSFHPLPAHNLVLATQGFLTVAFLVETLLMGMHSKPNPLDNLVHVLLTGVMVACVVVCAAEIAAPNSLLLALLRAIVVFFQGTWFWHVGAIMFRGEWG